MVSPKLTYEDYKNTPEGERHELLDGVLVRLETLANRSPASRYGPRNAAWHLFVEGK